MKSNEKAGEFVEIAELNEDFTLGLKDYLGIVRRRIGLILLTTVAVTTVIVIVVRRMPNLYRAETVILVDPQEVSNTLVPSIITSSVSDRLTTIQQEITSPTRLHTLIESMNLFADLRKTLGEQRVIAEMQKAISVQVVEPGGHGMNAFRVGFYGKNPVEVAAVANQLAALFISENLKLREKQSFGTAEFLDDEQKRTKQQLEQKEAELDEVKSKYVLDLPESKQYHMEALATLRNQLQASQDRANQAQQQKIYLQSLMTTQAPTVDLDAGVDGGSQVANAEVQKLEAQLSALRARYGNKHPDVRKLEAQLKEATQRTPKQAGMEVAPPVIRDAPSSIHKPGKNPVLIAQIERLDEDIEKAKQEQHELEQQIAFHEDKMQKIPLVEQRISGIMRDYDSLRAHYSALENKKLDADTASALETREKGERFIPLDRATVPTQPYSPKRAMISVAGLLAGLGIGLGLAVLLEARLGTIHTKEQVRGLFGEIPILATIPRITTMQEVRMKWLRAVFASLATIAGSVAVGMGISHWMNRI